MNCAKWKKKQWKLSLFVYLNKTFDTLRRVKCVRKHLILLKFQIPRLMSRNMWRFARSLSMCLTVFVGVSAVCNSKSIFENNKFRLERIRFRYKYDTNFIDFYARKILVDWTEMIPLDFLFYVLSLRSVVEFRKYSKFRNAEEGGGSERFSTLVRNKTKILWLLSYKCWKKKYNFAYPPAVALFAKWYYTCDKTVCVACSWFVSFLPVFFFCTFYYTQYM